MAELVLQLGESPESNDVRVGRVDSTAPLRVTIQGEVIQGGILASAVAGLAIGDPVACLRQGASWLVLGEVISL